MKKILIILLVFTTSLCVYAQRSHIERGDEAFSTHMYDIAKDHYERALGSIREQRDIAYVNYQLGYCYKMLGNSLKAENHFKVAVENYVQGAIRPDVLLFYADALRMNGKYEDAIEIYEEYLKINPNDHRAINGLKSCKLVPQWINRPTRHRVTNMSRLNSAHLDFSPTWASRDFRVIYFTTSREGTLGDRNNYRSGQKFTDIFEIVQDRQGNWGEPQPILGGVNTIEDEGASTVSGRGNEMFFTRCRAGRRVDEPCRIYHAEKRGNAWGEARPVDFPGFENYEVGHPALSPNGNVLYFAAETPEGFGGMDLYYSTRTGSGIDFGRPMNLGPNINTSGNEVFPTVRSNGTLYFASEGHPGMGGLDIFKAITDDNGNFIGVENMRYPINSSWDDFGIIFRGDEERGFFTSNRRGGKGGDDIYSFHLPPLQIALNGQVRDTTDMNNIRLIREAKITLANDEGVVAELSSGSTGSFRYQLEEGQNYNVRAEIDRDYFIQSVSFSTHNIEYDTVINVTINMGQIQRIIQLPNIEYAYDSHELRPESTVALDGLVKTLQENPHLKIKLRAHTDFRGRHEYNMELSQRRAQSCVDYLISKGIDSTRLVAQGYGKTDPREVTEEIAKEHDFLKEGDILTEEFITNLRNNQQIEIAHQLNRRTEFSVISNEEEDEGESIFVDDKKEDGTGGSVVIDRTDSGQF